MKLFLDANILFSASYKPESNLSKFWSSSKVILFSCDYAIEEARRNLKDQEKLSCLNQLTKNLILISHFQESLIPTDIILRAKDQPILAAAISAKADYLVTGDFKDFGVYFEKKIAGVIIAPPALVIKKLEL